MSLLPLAARRLSAMAKTLTPLSLTIILILSVPARVPFLGAHVGLSLCGAVRVPDGPGQLSHHHGSNCSGLKWPRADLHNTCPLPLHKIISDCENTPGPPQNLEADNILQHNSFDIRIRWQDPVNDDSMPVVGYELSLHRISSNIKYSWVEKKIQHSTQLLTLFSLSKTFTALRDHPSTNMVVFTTAVEAKDYCKRHCVELGEGALKSLLKLDRRRTYVKITSLPVRTVQVQDNFNQSIFTEIKIKPCDTEESKCLREFGFNSVRSNAGCYPRNDEGYKDVCECYMYNVFKFNDITYTRGSITVSWTWGPDSHNAKVWLIVKVSNHSYHLDLDVLDNGTSHTRNISVRHGMRISVKAQRIVHKHNHKGFREMKKRVTFQRDEYTTPNANPSHQVLKIDGTDKVLSTAPVPSAQNKPIGSSTSAVISVATAGILVLLLALVTVLFVRLCRERHGGELKFSSGRLLTLQHCHFARPKSTRPQECSEVEFTKPIVYISYSRCCGTSKANAIHLAVRLAESGVHPVLDEHYRHEMADNEPGWVEEQITGADHVIVLLDRTHPWVMENTPVMQLLSVDEDNGTLLVKLESELLRSQVYCGHPRFVVPVFIGPSCLAKACIPTMLQCKTVFRLPQDFNGHSTSFMQLTTLLKATTATVERRRLSITTSL